MVHLLNTETQRAASLAGVYLMGFYNVPWVFMLSLQSSNTAGATKKSFMGISISILYGKHLFHFKRPTSCVVIFIGLTRLFADSCR